ncbi:glycoside hydrolase family 6 protein [Roseateles amylovorans]|uniref:Glucanase n=1 Tax=Roseateles amylovorans TaxID=2978473 RepID=A0ABY6B8P5_9BURK|nr:glycoside hydrolase family 6 protein [Roseateles amylovorans]UXH80753.1 glycoside hydrolase family 6 protein [Roseateles amylovorans]
MTYPDTFYTDPTSEARKWVDAHPSDSRASSLRTQIADQPAARWVGDWTSDVGGNVSSYVASAAAAGRTPILVAYNIPHRDCAAGQSAGGAASAAAYRNWISAFAAGVGARPAVVVLEPDALAHLTDSRCDAFRTERLELLNYAAQQFKDKSPTTKVFLDIGHGGWLTPETSVQWLKLGGIQNVRGFALNVSNFQTTAQESAHGKAIVDLLASAGFAGKTFVIDTSRNGNGPAGDGIWCNPAGRRLGTASTLSAAGAGPEMTLWIKSPGQSDGQCGTSGQAAGVFDPELAIKLVNGN